MRTLLFMLTGLAVMALAFWAYRENYRTQAAADRMQAVQTEIAGLNEQLGLLRAEWAFLNRPQRLAELVRMNQDKLQLQPLTPGQFVAPTQLAFPLPDVPVPPPAAIDPATDPATGAPVWTGPSQNPGAPPRRPTAMPTTPPSPESQP